MRSILAECAFLFSFAADEADAIWMERLIQAFILVHDSILEVVVYGSPLIIRLLHHTRLDGNPE